MSTYPWLQSLSGADRRVKMDPFVLGRQLAVALTLRAEENSSFVQVLARNARAARFQEVFVRLHASFDNLLPMQVLVVMDQHKLLVKEALTEAFNDARRAALKFPESVEVREVCADRQLQTLQLVKLCEKIVEIPSDSPEGQLSPEAAAGWQTGCFGLFMDGVGAATAASAIRELFFYMRTGARGHVPQVTSGQGRHGGARAGLKRSQQGTFAPSPAIR